MRLAVPLGCRWRRLKLKVDCLLRVGAAEAAWWVNRSNLVGGSRALLYCIHFAIYFGTRTVITFREVGQVACMEALHGLYAHVEYSCSVHVP